MPERKQKFLKSTTDLEPKDIRGLYDGFDSPLAIFDCGKNCAPFNPSGEPFCCDIDHAVPAVYKSEWNHLKQSTDLWHKWRVEESRPEDVTRLHEETPNNMILLACLGLDRCQRKYRTLSCRQFPFFPYVTSDYRFLGMAYEWEFESKCWVTSNLSQVTQNIGKNSFTPMTDYLLCSRMSLNNMPFIRKGCVPTRSGSESVFHCCTVMADIIWAAQKVNV